MRCECVTGGDSQLNEFYHFTFYIHTGTCNFSTFINLLSGVCFSDILEFMSYYHT